GDLKPEPSLPHPARAGEDEEARLGLLEKTPDLEDLALAPDEGRGLHREVVGKTVQGAKRGELRDETRGHELEDTLRPLQILEPVLAEVLQVSGRRQALPRELGGARPEQDLSSVGGVGEPRAAVERGAEVVIALTLDLTRVQAHAHSERADL